MKPRHGARIDDVQPAIVETLRRAGAMVLVLDVSEEGAPDLAVLWLGSTTLLEVKAGAGKLRAGQVLWRDAAAAHGVRVHLVRTPREALDAIGVTGPKAKENLQAMRTMVSERRRVVKIQGKAQPSVRSYRPPAWLEPTAHAPVAEVVHPDDGTCGRCGGPGDGSKVCAMCRAFGEGEP